MIAAKTIRYKYNYGLSYNLLYFTDIFLRLQLVEHVATCLIKIAERVQESSEMLDELSKHGLIHQVAYLIDLMNHTTLSYSVHTVSPSSSIFSNFCFFFQSFLKNSCVFLCRV